MKFIHTLSAAKTAEGATWAVADGLVQDYAEAGVRPTALHFKEASETLREKGFTYEQATCQNYWRVASAFTKSRRKAGKSLSLYLEFTSALWTRLPEETRSNDLVSHASAFFAGGGRQGWREARTYARETATELDNKRRIEEEKAQKEAYRKQLQVAEDNLSTMLTLTNAKRPQVEAALYDVNRLRGYLNMADLEIDFEADEPQPKENKESAKKQQDEAAKKQADAEHQNALSRWEKELAVLSIQIRAVANVWVAVRDDLTEDDRESGVEQISQMQARMDVVKNDIAGEINEDDLQAALAAWTSE